MAGFCTQCGATLTGHERFCPTCGTAVNAEQHAAPTVPQPAPPPPPPAASAPWSTPGAYAPPGQAPPGPPPPPPSGTGVPYAPPAWYPPAPSTANPPASRALATWLQVLLWIAAALYVIAGIVVLVVRAAAESFYDAPAGSDFDEAQRWIDREDLGNVVQGFSWFVGLAVFVLLVIWAFQLTRAVNRHQPYGRRWSPGWAVGAWFIPLANCVLCPMILWEDEKIATAGATDVRDRWKSISPRPLVIIWFVLWAIAAVLLTFSTDALEPDRRKRPAEPVIGDERLRRADHRRAHRCRGIGRRRAHRAPPHPPRPRGRHRAGLGTVAAAGVDLGLGQPAVNAPG